MLAKTVGNNSVYLPKTFQFWLAKYKELNSFHEAMYSSSIQWGLEYVRCHGYAANSGVCRMLR